MRQFDTQLAAFVISTVEYIPVIKTINPDVWFSKEQFQTGFETVMHGHHQ